MPFKRTSLGVKNILVALHEYMRTIFRQWLLHPTSIINDIHYLRKKYKIFTNQYQKTTIKIQIFEEYISGTQV